MLIIRQTFIKIKMRVPNSISTCQGVVRSHSKEKRLSITLLTMRVTLRVAPLPHSKIPSNNMILTKRRVPMFRDR